MNIGQWLEGNATQEDCFGDFHIRRDCCPYGGGNSGQEVGRENRRWNKRRLKYQEDEFESHTMHGCGEGGIIHRGNEV